MSTHMDAKRDGLPDPWLREMAQKHVHTRGLTHPLPTEPKQWSIMWIHILLRATSVPFAVEKRTDPKIGC